MLPLHIALRDVILLIGNTLGNACAGGCTILSVLVMGPFFVGPFAVGWALGSELRLSFSQKLQASASAPLTASIVLAAWFMQESHDPEFRAFAVGSLFMGLLASFVGVLLVAMGMRLSRSRSAETQLPPGTD